MRECASVQTRTLTRVITADEYDAAARLSPHLCPLIAAGDRRTGRELLASTAADARLSVAAVASTAAGRAELERIGDYAAAVRDHFAARAAARRRGADRPLKPPVRHGGAIMLTTPGAGTLAAARAAEGSGAREWWSWPAMRRVWAVGYKVRRNWMQYRAMAQ
jgi:hypothetical protein